MPPAGNTLHVPDNTLILKDQNEKKAVVHEDECGSCRHISTHERTGPVKCSKLYGRSLDAGCALKRKVLRSQLRAQGRGIQLQWLCHMLCLPQEAET